MGVLFVVGKSAILSTQSLPSKDPLVKDMSSRAFLEEIVDVIISSSSDEEAGLSDRQSARESEDIQHPASCGDWNLLTVRQRENKLHEYENALKRQRQNLRNRQRRARINEERYDWSLKPRSIEEVATHIGLTVGERFSTRQRLQLRISEVCQHLYKVPRYTPKVFDGVTSKTCVNNNWVCARAWGMNC